MSLTNVFPVNTNDTLLNPLSRHTRVTHMLVHGPQVPLTGDPSRLSKLTLPRTSALPGSCSSTKNKVILILILVVRDLPPGHLHEFVIEILDSASVVSKSSSVTCESDQISTLIIFRVLLFSGLIFNNPI